MQRGATPLYIAAQNGHLGVVKCLVEFRAATSKARWDGATPLVVAAHNGHVGVVRFLSEFEETTKCRCDAPLTEAGPTCRRFQQLWCTVVEKLRCPPFLRRLTRYFRAARDCRCCPWRDRHMKRSSVQHFPEDRSSVAEPLLWRRPEPLQLPCADSVAVTVTVDVAAGIRNCTLALPRCSLSLPPSPGQASQSERLLVPVLPLLPRGLQPDVGLCRAGTATAQKAVDASSGVDFDSAEVAVAFGTEISPVNWRRARWTTTMS